MDKGGASGGVRRTGLVLGLGHSATEVVPIVDGAPDFQHSLRVGVSGMGLTSHLQSVLEVSHGKALGNRKEHPLSGFNLAEEMKASCYVSADYRETLRSIQQSQAKKEGAAAGGEGEGDQGGAMAASLTSTSGHESQEDMAATFATSESVARAQIPEIYFQPSIAGLDQMSIPETLFTLSESVSGARGLADYAPLQSVLLVGGSSLFRGMGARIEAELRTRCRVGADLRVLRARDPSLDAC